jgi:hypothetical protein
MARNNYSFKKRQKEIKRQKKREEKRQRRLAKKDAGLEQASTENDPGDAPDEESKAAAGHTDVAGAAVKE